MQSAEGQTKLKTAGLLILAGLALALTLLVARQTLYDIEQGECSWMKTQLLELRGESPIDYEKITRIAEPKNQIRAIIRQVSQWQCLPSGHWYRISVDPFHEGVVMNDNTLSEFKSKNESIGIYLQHQFLDLRARPSGIHVIVYFNEMPDPIFIPYDAITWFDDPGHGFEVQLDGQEGKSDDSE